MSLILVESLFKIICVGGWGLAYGSRSYDVTKKSIWSSLVCGRILNSSVVYVFNLEIIAIRQA